MKGGLIAQTHETTRLKMPLQMIDICSEVLLRLNFFLDFGYDDAKEHDFCY